MTASHLDFCAWDRVRLCTCGLLQQRLEAGTIGWQEYETHFNNLRRLERAQIRAKKKQANQQKYYPKNKWRFLAANKRRRERLGDKKYKAIQREQAKRFALRQKLREVYSG